MFYHQQDDEYGDDNFYELGRMQTILPHGQVYDPQELKGGHRNVRKIDGPVIPTEYSDPELQRQSSEFSAILQQATANVSAKRHESTFVMDISPSVVGWIIGRSGIRIKEIQSYTGCKMWVDQDVPNDQPRKIYFHGSKQNIDAAVSRVNELVQAAPILSSTHVVSGKGLTSVIVDCPVSLVGLLIGKRGWTIKKIQQASNAQISINQSVREGLPRKIIVSGDEKSVSTALKLITEVLRDKTLLGAGGEYDGHQLTMRTISGYPPRDSSMRDVSFDSAPHGGPLYSVAPQGGLGYPTPPSRSNMSSPGISYSPTSSSPSLEMNPRDRYSPAPLQQQQSYHSQPSSVYHNNAQGQGGGYQQQHLQPKRNTHPSQARNDMGYQHGQQDSSNRLFSNQYGHSQAVPVPVRRGSNPSYEGRYYPAAEQYGDHHHQQQQFAQDYGKYVQRTSSPNTVEAAGQSFNSTIFDFQHRSPPSSHDVMGKLRGHDDDVNVMNN